MAGQLLVTTQQLVLVSGRDPPGDVEESEVRGVRRECPTNAAPCLIGSEVTACVTSPSKMPVAATFRRASASTEPHCSVVLGDISGQVQPD